LHRHDEITKESIDVGTRNMQWCYKHTTQQRENYQQKNKRHIVGTQWKRILNNLSFANIVRNNKKN
jgi:hypothetical protein